MFQPRIAQHAAPHGNSGARLECRVGVQHLEEIR